MNIFDENFANETEYVEKICYPKAKHEIFLSLDNDLRDYYCRIFNFFCKIYVNIYFKIV